MYFEIYKDTVGQYRWRLKGGNNEIIAHGESYSGKTDVERAIGLVKGSANAQVKDLTVPVKK